MKLNETFLVLALVAEIIGTIGGFGSSVFFVPLGNFYFDFYSVLGLTALFHLSSNLSKIFLFKKGLNKFLLVYIGIPSVVFVILGGFLSKWIQTQYLELTLGVFLIGLSLLFLIKKNLVIKPQKNNRSLVAPYQALLLASWELAGPFGDLPWQHSISKKMFLLPLQPLSIL